MFEPFSTWQKCFETTPVLSFWPAASLCNTPVRPDKSLSHRSPAFLEGWGSMLCNNFYRVAGLFCHGRASAEAAVDRGYALARLQALHVQMEMPAWLPVCPKRASDWFSSVRVDANNIVPAGLRVETGCDRERPTPRFPGWGDQRTPENFLMFNTICYQGAPEWG